jgi:hypothetical protein
MISARRYATETQKNAELARHPEREPARQLEQGLVQAVAPQVVYRRAQASDNGLRPADLLALQRTVGNRQVQRMVAQRSDNPNDKRSFTPLITEETIDLSAGVPQALVQRRPLSSAIRRAGDGDEPTRKDYVFLMGSTGGFYTAAKQFFKGHHPKADIITLRDSSLAGVFAKLRQVASDDHPVGNLYIMSHANAEGTLSFGLTEKDADRKTTFGELKNALAKSPELFRLNGGIDGKTKIHIKGCNIGRNLDMLNALDEAFGKNVKVDAPTHKQGYEYHQERQGKTIKDVSSEYFNTYNVEFSGRADKSDDELVKAFRDKYSEVGFSDQDWKIAVLGTEKYGKKVDTAASASKKEIDKALKEGLAKLAKEAADTRSETKRLRQEAKTKKADIDTKVREAKKTVVARGSKGVSKAVVTPFSALLFNDELPPANEPEILKKAPQWFPRAAKRGWKFTAGVVAKSKAGDRDVLTYKIDAQNKDRSAKFEYEIIVAPFPKTDDDAKILARAQLEKYLEKHPDRAIARAGMFDWRITRDKKGGKTIITAFLEMTIYTIDLDLRMREGDKIDPATRQGKEFFFGESQM